jgi:hypothetical protein
MVHTIGSVLGEHDITVPDETLAELEVPVLCGPQRQGDVLIVPRSSLTAAERKQTVPVPAEGVAVVRGEATGNTHLLHGEGPVVFSRRDSDLLLGVVEVGDGGTGFLIHTDEHGVNAFGPGCYELRGKREQADLIRRVAD